MRTREPRVRLKYACKGGGEYGLNIAASEYVDDGVRLIRTTDLAGGRLAEEGAIFVRTEAVSSGDLLQAGDLLLSRSGTVGRAFLVPTEATGMAYAGFLVRFRTRSDVDPRFMYYCTQSVEFQSAVQAEAITSTIQNFNAERYNNLAIPKPHLKEQRAIAGYLDRETARIDALIEEQQRLIDLLRERRRSLIDGAFSAHAPNVRLQNACIAVIDCPHTTPEVSEDGEYEAVRTASIRNGKFRPGNGLAVNAETWKARNAAGAPSIGDVLFTREAPAGEACLVPNDRICLGQRTVLLRVDSTVCVGAFLLWQLYSDRVQNHFLLSANGSTVVNVRLPALRTTPLWLPSLTEQSRLAAYLETQTTKIDDLIKETERFIDLSRERRSALITAAVTGQIDVQEMA